MIQLAFYIQNGISLFPPFESHILFTGFVCLGRQGHTGATLQVGWSENNLQSALCLHCVGRELNCHQAWQHAPSPTEPSLQPFNLLKYTSHLQHEVSLRVGQLMP